MKEFALLVAASAVTLYSHDLTVAYIGVPANVIVACAAGAYASFSFGDKVEPRSKMFGIFVACIIIGAAFTALTQASVEYFTPMRITQGGQAALGAVVSCLTRFFMPWVVDVVKHGRWLDWLPIKRNNTGGK